MGFRWTEQVCLLIGIARPTLGPLGLTNTIHPRTHAKHGFGLGPNVTTLLETMHSIEMGFLIDPTCGIHIHWPLAVILPQKPTEEPT